MAPMQSTPSSSTPLVVSIVIVVSSVVGASTVLLIVILIIILRRHTLYARQRARTAGHEPVPRLVITDTSMFPASTVVVEGGAELDRVIASFKPFGSELSDSDEFAVIGIRRTAYESKKDEDDVRLGGSRSGGDDRTAFQQTHMGEGDEVVSALCHRDSRTLYGTGSLGSSSGKARGPKGIWWHDFHVDDADLASLSSQSDISEICETDSVHSSISVKVEIELSELAKEPTSTSLIKRLQNANLDHKSGREAVFSACLDADSRQDTIFGFDKQVLGYCWRISDDTTGQDADRTMVAISSGPHATRPSVKNADESIDQNILEYCWRITDHRSLNDVGDLSTESVALRSTTAVKSVSNASVSGLAVTLHHDSGLFVLHSDSLSSHKDGRNIIADELVSMRTCTRSLQTSIRKSRSIPFVSDLKLKSKD